MHPDIRVRFHACVIATAGIATDDEGDYFEGQVDFDLSIDDALQRGLVAKVKQAAGSSFSDPLEVQWPVGYVGRLPYRGFRDCVERYVRRQDAARTSKRDRSTERNVRLHGVRLPAEDTCSVSAGAS
jgi:hypothetical protein